MALACLATSCATVASTRLLVQGEEAGAAPASVDETGEPAKDEAFAMLKEIIGNMGKVTNLPVTDPSAPPVNVADGTEVVGEDRDGDLLIAPIPFQNPTIGAGLALGAAYLIPLGKNSPPSMISGGALYSENDTAGAAFGFKGYFDEDRYRLSVGLAQVRVNYNLTLANGQIVALRQDVVALAAEFLVRVAERVFVGPQLVLSGLNTAIRQSEDAGTIPESELDVDSLSVGLRVQRDTRDSTFFPRAGSFADAQYRIYDPELGGTFAYQILPVSYNAFFSPGEKDVVALRGAARLAFGDVPFYGESFVGAQSDLRGYTVGTIHDEVLVAVQAEYRRELIGRLGAVAFAGVGAVAPTLSEIGDADTLPSAGFGLRFTLEKDNHVNFRLDFAWGEDESVIYFGVGEAF
ncbi:MAG: outer membrane protein assembly factor BamA [Chlamydiales bacterium]|jgi:outer membrane protein assembly factor BamA